MGASSRNKAWRVEHHENITPTPEYAPQWVTWKRRFDFDTALARLVKMTKLHDHYIYRIRNVDTGEVIPGELLVHEL